ncbi:hypothetical protein NDA16_005053 [Ustilago loliicola]|nr:hypothetical protein NDA16_005053 [Ustilago loliicola]
MSNTYSNETGFPAPPPSYQAAVRSAARPGTSSSREMPQLTASSSEKQFRGFSEMEQNEREQELRSYNYTGHRDESNRGLASSSSSPDAFRSTCAVTSYGGQVVLDPKTALSQFGSPFARNAKWRPSQQDALLTHLPQLELELRIKMHFSGPSVTPPSFARRFNSLHPAASLQFEPVYIRSANKKEAHKQLLADGFQPVYPGRLMVQRDVSAADWGRFLEDLTVAGKLTGKQSLISNVAPITMHIGVTGFLVTRAI